MAEPNPSENQNVLDGGNADLKMVNPLDDPGEPKPDEPKPDEPKPDEPKPDEPVDYNFEDFTIPKDVTADAKTVATYKQIFTDLKLDKEQAQAFVDARVKEAQEVGKNMQDFLVNRDGEWEKEMKADSQFGGEKYASTMSKVNKVLKTFDADGSFFQIMQDAQLQKCAPLFKMLARIAPHFGEDVLVTGGDKTQKKVTPHMSMGYKEVNEY